MHFFSVGRSMVSNLKEKKMRGRINLITSKLAFLGHSRFALYTNLLSVTLILRLSGHPSKIFVFLFEFKISIHVSRFVTNTYLGFFFNAEIISLLGLFALYSTLYGISCDFLDNSKKKFNCYFAMVQILASETVARSF